jgi:hypothetical protein
MANNVPFGQLKMDIMGLVLIILGTLYTKYIAEQ